MMTSKNITEAKRVFRPFIDNCKAYKALLAENELPLSVDIDELLGVLKAQMFAKLLAVDAGLKMRFEMLRTESAQQQLINSTIDLAGYSIVPTLRQQVAQLERGFTGTFFKYGTQWMGITTLGHTLEGLCHSYGLDLEQWLESERIDWTGYSVVLAYFTDLAIRATELRALKRLTDNRSTVGLEESVGPFLTGFFTSASEDGKIEPDEYRLMREMVPLLEKSGKLANFPASLQ